MAKYRLKIEGIDDVNPTPHLGKIDIYYNTETNAVEVNTPTEQAIITEAEPELTAGTTPNDGDVLEWNTGLSAWIANARNNSLSGLDDVSLAGTPGVTNGNFISYDSGTSKWVLNQNVMDNTDYLDINVPIKMNDSTWTYPTIMSKTYDMVNWYGGHVDVQDDLVEMKVSPNGTDIAKLTVYKNGGVYEILLNTSISGEGCSLVVGGAHNQIQLEGFEGIRIAATGSATNDVILKADNITTSDKTIQLPDASGTIALTETINGNDSLYDLFLIGNGSYLSAFDLTPDIILEDGYDYMLKMQMNISDSRENIIGFDTYSQPYLISNDSGNWLISDATQNAATINLPVPANTYPYDLATSLTCNLIISGSPEILTIEVDPTSEISGNFKASAKVTIIKTKK